MTDFSKHLCAYTIAYREEEFIEAAIRSAYPYCGRYLVMLNDRPFNGDEEKYPPDGTGEILDRLVASGEFPNLVVRRGFWGDEVSCRNYAIDAVIRFEWPDISHVWIVDSDEGYLNSEAAALVEFAERYSSTHTLFYARCRTYWRDFGWVIAPMEPRCPLVIHNIVNVKKDEELVSPFYTSIRNMTKGAKIVVPETICVQFHASYVRASDARILEKIETSPHAAEMLPGWFENVWMKWTPEMEDIHPTNPACYKRAVPSDPASIPESFRGLTQFLPRPHSGGVVRGDASRFLIADGGPELVLPPGREIPS